MRETAGSKKNLDSGCFSYFLCVAIPQTLPPVCAKPMVYFGWRSRLCFQEPAAEWETDINRQTVEFLETMELAGPKAHISLVYDFKFLESDCFWVIDVTIACG